MTLPARISLIPFCLLLVSVPVGGQSQPAKDAPRTSGQAQATTRRAGVKGDKKPATPDDRKEIAVSLLRSLTVDARSFKSESLRAQVLTRAADIMWSTDADAARTLFRQAWDAAKTSALRSEVLRFVGRRDPALREEFFAKLPELIEKEAAAAAANATDKRASVTPAGMTPDPENPPPAVTQQLMLAKRLLQDGDTEHAMQLADMALGIVTVQGINFLSMLREKNPTAADNRYMAVLAREQNNPAADAGTVSILSSYVLTPFLNVVVTRDGTHSLQERPNVAPPELSPQLRMAFLKAGAQILLRPAPAPDQDLTRAGRTGTYFVISRLLPVYQQYAPDMATLLSAQMASLTPDAAGKLPRGSEELLKAGLVPEVENRNEGDMAVEQIERTQDTQTRDSLYAVAATTAAKTLDPKALELAEKISDVDLRGRVKGYIDFMAALSHINKKKPTEAYELARRANISKIQRVWLLTETANLLSKDDTAQALRIIGEATAEARRMDAADPDRVRALVAVAASTYKINQLMAWEAAGEVIKAANGTPDYKGDGGQLVVRLELRDGATEISLPAESFSLNTLFNQLANNDLTRAIDLAKGLSNDTPRAVASLSIVRSVLDQKPAENNKQAKGNGN